MKIPYQGHLKTNKSNYVVEVFWQVHLKHCKIFLENFEK